MDIIKMREKVLLEISIMDIFIIAESLYRSLKKEQVIFSSKGFKSRIGKDLVEAMLYYGFDLPDGMIREYESVFEEIKRVKPEICKLRDDL